MGQTTKCNKDVIRGKSELPFVAAKTLEPGMLAAPKSFRHARRAGRKSRIKGPMDIGAAFRRAGPRVLWGRGVEKQIGTKDRHDLIGDSRRPRRV